MHVDQRAFMEQSWPLGGTGGLNCQFGAKEALK